MTDKPLEIHIGDKTLRVGDRVVYPNQGICKITGVEHQQIGGHSLELVTMAREEDGAKVMVPKAKVSGIGLRRVATVQDIEEIFDFLAQPADGPQLDWKVRHRENADRMSGGGLFGTVEVLKSLHVLSRLRPLPQKERELYDSARHLIVGEIGAAMNIPSHAAEDSLDYVLWPPEGMTYKGKPLQLATPIAAAPAGRASDDDDDLGLEDEIPGLDRALADAGSIDLPGEEPEEESPTKPDSAGHDEDDEGGDDDEAPAKPSVRPAAKATKPKAAPAAKGDKPPAKPTKPAAPAKAAAAKSKSAAPAKPKVAKPASAAKAKPAPKVAAKPAAKPTAKAAPKGKSKGKA